MGCSRGCSHDFEDLRDQPVYLVPNVGGPQHVDM